MLLVDTPHVDRHGKARADIDDPELMDLKPRIYLRPSGMSGKAIIGGMYAGIDTLPSVGTNAY